DGLAGHGGPAARTRRLTRRAVLARRRHDDPRAAALPGARGGRVTPTPARWAAGGLLVLTVAALAASAGFGIAAHEWRDAFAFVPVLLAFAGVGAFVASHRPRNAIGWLFLAEGLGAALSLAGLRSEERRVGKECS